MVADIMCSLKDYYIKCDKNLEAALGHTMSDAASDAIVRLGSDDIKALGVPACDGMNPIDVVRGQIRRRQEWSKHAIDDFHASLHTNLACSELDNLRCLVMQSETTKTGIRSAGRANGGGAVEQLWPSEISSSVRASNLQSAEELLHWVITTRNAERFSCLPSQLEAAFKRHEQGYKPNNKRLRVLSLAASLARFLEAAAEATKLVSNTSLAAFECPEADVLIAECGGSAVLVHSTICRDSGGTTGHATVKYSRLVERMESIGTGFHDLFRVEVLKRDKLRKRAPKGSRGEISRTLAELLTLQKLRELQNADPATARLAGIGNPSGAAWARILRTAIKSGISPDETLAADIAVNEAKLEGDGDAIASKAAAFVDELKALALTARRKLGALLELDASLKHISGGGGRSKTSAPKKDNKRQQSRRTDAVSALRAYSNMVEDLRSVDTYTREKIDELVTLPTAAPTVKEIRSDPGRLGDLLGGGQEAVSAEDKAWSAVVAAHRGWARYQSALSELEVLANSAINAFDHYAARSAACETNRADGGSEAYAGFSRSVNQCDGWRSTPGSTSAMRGADAVLAQHARWSKATSEGYLCLSLNLSYRVALNTPATLQTGLPPPPPPPVAEIELSLPPLPPPLPAVAVSPAASSAFEIAVTYHGKIAGTYLAKRCQQDDWRCATESFHSENEVVEEKDDDCDDNVGDDDIGSDREGELDDFGEHNKRDLTCRLIKEIRESLGVKQLEEAFTCTTAALAKLIDRRPGEDEELFKQCFEGALQALAEDNTIMFWSDDTIRVI
jgi:hypothetical protein